MKKILWIVLISLSSMWLFSGMSFSSEGSGMKAPEAELIIEGEKKSARFSHPVHMEIGIECGQCHHNKEHQPLTAEEIGAMKNNLQLRCSSCHNENLSNPKLNSPKAAFHARCKDCHKQGVNGKKGPTKCTDCHVKN